MRFTNIQKPVNTARMFPFVFALKTDKFWFAANGMQTIHGQHSAGSQSHPHIHAFGSQTIRPTHVYEALGFK